jgi:LacI family transcriptional regulator
VKKRVSLKDIASHLGVSIALVSYVVNGREKEKRVAPDMAEKIRKAIKDLNYQPNFIGKSLQSGQTRTIGLIVADIANPFFSAIARNIEEEAKKQGYVVIFGSSDESADKSKNLVEVFLNHQVDAFIIAPAAGTADQVRELQNKKIPVVLIDRYFRDFTADGVRIDNFGAAENAVRHLAGGKRRRIAMLAYDTDLPHMQDRIAGYRSALKEKGIAFQKKWLALASYQHIEKDTEKALRRLLQPLQIDALFFATNSLAVAGLKKIKEWGIRIPRELAIVSFDRSEAFDFFYAPLSFISQPLDAIAKEAVKLAISGIQGKIVHKTTVLQAKLILRDSSK